MIISWKLTFKIKLVYLGKVSPLTQNFFFFTILIIWQGKGMPSTQSSRQKEGKVGSPTSKETNVGLDPSILGWWPEPKAHT